MVTFAEILPPYPNRMWMLCQQMNVTHAVTAVPIGPEGFAYWTPERIAATKVGERPWDFYPILYMTQRFADAGLTVDVIESSPPMDRARLGLPGRDEEIADVCTMLQSMGAAGIPVWCYNWMAQFNWQRTSTLDAGARWRARLQFRLRARQGRTAHPGGRRQRGASLGDLALLPRKGRAGGGGGGRHTRHAPGRPAPLADPGRRADHAQPGKLRPPARSRAEPE